MYFFVSLKIEELVGLIAAFVVRTCVLFCNDNHRLRHGRREDAHRMNLHRCWLLLLLLMRGCRRHTLSFCARSAQREVTIVFEGNGGGGGGDEVSGCFCCFIAAAAAVAAVGAAAADTTARRRSCRRCRGRVVVVVVGRLIGGGNGNE